MFLCDACLILLVGLVFAFPEDKAVGNKTALDEVKGNCSCGGFDSRGGDAPLLVHSPGLAVECAAGGNATCATLCLALATATRAKGPEVLCTRLKDCTDLKLSVYYKICDGPWASANMTAEEALCCENSNWTPCASALTTTTTPIPAPAPAGSSSAYPVTRGPV